MIIDFHAHLMSPKLIGQKYWDNWVRLSSILSGRPPERVEKRLPEVQDDNGELLIADMDAAGIDYSVISVIDYGLAKRVGEASMDILEINRLYAEVARKYPNRLIPIAGVDPRRKNALEVLKTSLNDFGMKGIKLLPPTGFYPNDRICYPIYELAQEHDLPVLVHTGPETSPLDSKYCYPIFLDEVANDFPDLKIIMAHSGFCWWPEAVNIAATKPNVYLDLAGWQPRVRQLPVEEFYQPLKVMLKSVGSSRILFGSDWPALRLMMNSEKWLNVFRNPPPEIVEAGLAPTEEENADMLGNTAAKLLKIQA